MKSFSRGTTCQHRNQTWLTVYPSSKKHPSALMKEEDIPGCCFATQHSLSLLLSPSLRTPVIFNRFTRLFFAQIQRGALFYTGLAAHCLPWSRASPPSMKSPPVRSISSWCAHYIRVRHSHKGTWWHKFGCQTVPFSVYKEIEVKKVDEPLLQRSEQDIY